MLDRPDETAALTRTGFTEAQAGALSIVIDRSATRVVDDLRHDLERWHVALSLYLLIQIGIALLAFLMVQALRDPNRGGLAAYHVGERPARSGGDTRATARGPARQTRRSAATINSTVGAQAAA